MAVTITLKSSVTQAEFLSQTYTCSNVVPTVFITFAAAAKVQVARVKEVKGAGPVEV